MEWRAPAPNHGSLAVLIVIVAALHTALPRWVNHVAWAMSVLCRLTPIPDMTVRIANCSDGPFSDIGRPGG